MDHEDVLEQIELAAVEPDGIDRLMAGDTPVSAAVAGHLAACESCSSELERLRRAAPLIRDVVRTTPPDDLRERTLAYVRERGIDRRGGEAAAPAPGTTAASVEGPSPRSRTRTALPWVASIAAAVAISVAATTLIVGGRVDEQLAAQQKSIDQLSYITASTLAVTGEEDAERVALEATTDAKTDGTLVFSPASTQLVVVATGLTVPPAGQEYRCWVEVAGGREIIGKMFFGGDLAYWAGDSPAVADLPAGSTFGVSITNVGSPSVEAPPVLVGRT